MSDRFPAPTVPTLLASLLATLFVLAPVAVRANDAAVQAASDAFGTSIGRETIGLYTSGSVRGFSPTAAGNVRIDGLYFDQVWGLSARLRQSSNVRVGLSAQGFVFPAPTGIVDLSLRRPDAEPSAQLVLGLDQWRGRYIDLDFSHPLSADGRWAVTGGFSKAHVEYGNGTDGEFTTGSLAVWWRPDVHTEAMVFASAIDTPYDRMGPQVSSATPSLPPLGEARVFKGPDWAAYSGVGRNYGATLRHAFDPAWQLARRPLPLRKRRPRQLQQSAAGHGRPGPGSAPGDCRPGQPRGLQQRRAAPELGLRPGVLGAAPASCSWPAAPATAAPVARKAWTTAA